MTRQITFPLLVFSIIASLFLAVGCGGGISGTNTGEGGSVRLQITDAEGQSLSNTEVSLDTEGGETLVGRTNETGIVTFLLAEGDAAQRATVSTPNASGSVEISGLVAANTNATISLTAADAGEGNLDITVTNVDEEPTPTSTPTAAPSETPSSGSGSGSGSSGSGSEGGSSEGGSSGSGSGGGSSSGGGSGGSAPSPTPSPTPTQTPAPSVTPTPTSTSTPTPSPTPNPGSPNIVVDPLLLDFEVVTVGNEGNIQLTITNTGTASLNVSSLVITGPDADEFSTSSPLLNNIAPSEQRTVTVSFAPQTPGVKNAELEISSDDPNESTVTVTLKGRTGGVGM